MTHFEKYMFYRKSFFRGAEMAGVKHHCAHHAQNNRSRGTEASSLRTPGGATPRSHNGEHVHTVTEYTWTYTYTEWNRG